MNRFIPEGSIRLSRLVPQKYCIVLLVSLGWRDGALSVYILFQHLWDVKHIRNLSKTTAKVIKTCHRLSVELETRIRVYRDCFTLSNGR